jgi:uncharacterized sulfatase
MLMTRKNVTRVFGRRQMLAGCAVAMLGVFSGSGWSAEARVKPNIVLVFIDDMGWADFSCFGNEYASTPNIDGLADEGIAFEQFYVNSPICSPSRIAISTGTYPQRWNITSYLSSRNENKKRGIANWLDPKAPMLARSLQRAGYATGHFGKWHMGGQHDVADAPPIHGYGFDESLSNFEGMGPKLLPLITRKDGTVDRIYPWEHLGEFTWMQRSEITTGFIDAAILFMEKAKEEGKPFYVNVWPDDVHGPFWPSLERLKKAKSNHERYMAVLEEMDAQFAALFDFMKGDPALRENTIILICSDNGPSRGSCYPMPFKGYKTHLYEGGVRSPLVVWAPGLMPQARLGTRNTNSVFSAIDLVPSLLSLAGVDGEQGADYDGENVTETLIGNSMDSRQQPIFFSRPPDRKNFYGVENLPDLAVRSGKWKLLCDYDGGRPELYDLSSDLGEELNLAEGQRGVVKKLVNQVTAWHQSMSNSRTSSKR